MNQENALAKNNFTEATEEEVIHLLLRDQAFNEKYNNLLHPSFFWEYLRPFVEIQKKYWQTYNKLIPDNALVQELTMRLGVGFTEEKLAACTNALEKLNQKPKNPEWTIQQIDHFLRYQSLSNALIGGMELVVECRKERDPSKLEEVYELLEKTKSRFSNTVAFHSYSMAEIDAMVGTEIPYLVRPYVPKGAIIDLFAKIKAGKTILSLNIAASICAGEPFLGEPCEKTTVVYLTEQSPHSFKSETDMIWPDEQPNNLHVFFIHDSRKAGLKWAEVMDKTATECQRLKAGMVIIDTFSAWAKFAENGENDAASADMAMAELSKLTSLGITVIMNRHGRKSGGEISDAARGSSAIGGGADILLHLKHPEGNPNGGTTRVLEATGRYQLPTDAIEIELKAGRYCCTGTAWAGKLGVNRDVVLSALTEDWLTGKQLENLTGLSKKQVHSAVTRLEFDGLIEKDDSAGSKNSPFQYRKCS
jgi:archaellum biogenesis ATPase FlaH